MCGMSHPLIRKIQWQSILEELEKITPEEEFILKGNREIEKNRYMSAKDGVIDAAKLLDAGKLIQIRTHTRFIHFPAHTHNYIEVVYMCSGRTHHVINGNHVILNQGELLFLNQKAVQEIYPAKEKDIAVNFIILPEFFDYGLRMMETEKNDLREFIVDCLREEKNGAGYLHFKVADVLSIQNLVENLIWTLLNKQSINLLTNTANRVIRIGQPPRYALSNSGSSNKPAASRSATTLPVS